MDTKFDFIENNIISFSIPQDVDFDKIEKDDPEKKMVIIQSSPSNIELHYSRFGVSKIQRYNPLYSLFFNLTENNYNNVFFNHRYQFRSLIELYDTTTNKIVAKESFVKFAPLLDPLRYMTGAYNLKDPRLKTLPTIQSNTTTCYTKYLSVMNASYIDNFFCFLSNVLLDNFGCINCIGYYGSFLGIQKIYKIAVEDDLEYLSGSEFFRENVNDLFFIENGEICESDDEADIMRVSRNHKPKLEICDDGDDALIDDICIKNEEPSVVDNTERCSNVMTSIYEKSQSEDEEPEEEEEEEDEDGENEDDEEDSEDDEDDSENDEEDEDKDEDKDEENEENKEDENSKNSEDDSDESTDSDSNGNYSDCETVAYISDYPVQMICLEKCENTFDYLLEKELLDEEQCIAALMQIIMSLVIYQKTLSLTHNDLHTNNIMYIKTNKEFIYYKYSHTYYKVPTHGRIFKIIDFGRSIYRFKNKIFFSDCFEKGGDANGQYNIEPFLNKKKTVVEPNFSFDLCRLGCSIYDFIFDRNKETDIKKMSPFKRLIFEWCLDDNKNNFLYNKRGNERYPGFKLYKQIARLKNNSQPNQQLKRQIFKQYVCDECDRSADIIDIDKIPIMI
jgi:hypothetical protein